MKAITPVIATIVLLLITVAIAGAAWTYITGYWTGTTGKQIEITDAFCVGTNQAKIIVKNIGTNALRTRDITIINRSSGADLTDRVLWTSQVTPPDYGMVMHLEFEEGSGNTVMDTAGNNNGILGDGTCTPGSGACPSWTDGKMGLALDFDGVNDYVETGQSGPSLSEISGDKLTIAAWIKPSASAGPFMIFIKNGPVYMYKSGNVLVAGVYTAALGWITVTGATPLSANWNHVAVTYDGNVARLYVNGVADTSLTAAGGSIAGDGCTQIGRYNNGACNGGPSWHFQGRIDDIRMYNRALSADEIASLAGNTQVDPGDTATMGNVCTGRCSYNVMLEGRSSAASVDCS